MVVIDESTSSKNLFSQVAKAIMNFPEAFTNAQPITNAKVPIIKFVDAQTQLHFDCSFNKDDGLRQVQELQKAFEVYPEMKYLLMILKCMLR